MTTDDQDTNATDDTPTHDDNSDAPAPDEDGHSSPTEEAEEAEEDPDDDDDDDEPEAKPAKPKKRKVSFEASMPRTEAISYFEAIVGGLASGRLEFKQDGDSLVLNPPDHLEIEVKASRKGDKGKVVFEIQWSGENRPIEITN